jgi:hypothetical protein
MPYIINRVGRLYEIRSAQTDQLVAIQSSFRNALRFVRAN